MKTRTTIRRENLAALVAKHGQAAVADKIGKDRNQIYQWLLDPEDKAARNISDRSAARIEDAYGHPRGWLDQEHPSVQDPGAEYGPASQSPQLDLAKLATAQKFLEDVFAGNGLKFVASEQTMLLAAVYDELMTKSESNLVEMAARFGKRIRGQDERQREAGSAIADDRGGDGESSKQTRIKNRRAG